MSRGLEVPRGPLGPSLPHLCQSCPCSSCAGLPVFPRRVLAERQVRVGRDGEFVGRGSSGQFLPAKNRSQCEWLGSLMSRSRVSRATCSSLPLLTVPRPLGHVHSASGLLAPSTPGSGIWQLCPSEPPCSGPTKLSLPPGGDSTVPAGWMELNQVPTLLSLRCGKPGVAQVLCAARLGPAPRPPVVISLSVSPPLCAVKMSRPSWSARSRPGEWLWP